jgi:hypothetical protein
MVLKDTDMLPVTLMLHACPVEYVPIPKFDDCTHWPPSVTSQSLESELKMPLPIADVGARVVTDVGTPVGAFVLGVRLLRMIPSISLRRRVAADVDLTRLVVKDSGTCQTESSIRITWHTVGVLGLRDRVSVAPQSEAGLQSADLMLDRQA